MNYFDLTHLLQTNELQHTNYIKNTKNNDVIL